LLADYNRLDLGHHGNIYHFITRHDGLLSLYECPYRMIDVEAVQLIGSGGSKSIQWTDGSKKFKLTFGDSQIHQWFDPQADDTNFLGSFEAPILDDPFAALLRLKGHESEPLRSVVPDESVASSREDIAYLPLYSFRSKQVEEKSGLNAWNAAPKSGDSPRPLNEIYVPIPREFHLKHPDFFTPDINAVLERKKNGERVGDIRFHVKLPNDKIIPCSITQSNFKAFQSGSQTELDESNKRYGQAALGQWLLIDVLGLKERKLVTKDWLNKKGIDSIRLRRVRSDFFELDIAPTHSFETFMAVDVDLSDSD